MRLQLHSGVIRLHDDNDRAARTLPLTLPGLIERSGLFRFPPGEQALEEAIALVEEALAPLLAQRPRGPVRLLEASGTSIALLLEAAAGNRAHEASREAVEALFGRLAMVAAGAPAASQGIAADPELVAVIVLVRELMHHGDFSPLRRLD